jgi:hypothetical protein
VIAITSLQSLQCAEKTVVEAVASDGFAIVGAVVSVTSFHPVINNIVAKAATETDACP